MLRALALCLLALSVAGCETPVQAVAKVLDRHVQGDQDHALVPGYTGTLDALPFATAHCGRFGKAARFNHTTPEGALFDCVKG